MPAAPIVHYVGKTPKKVVKVVKKPSKKKKGK